MKSQLNDWICNLIVTKEGRRSKKSHTNVFCLWLTYVPYLIWINHWFWKFLVKINPDQRIYVIIQLTRKLTCRSKNKILNWKWKFLHITVSDFKHILLKFWYLWGNNSARHTYVNWKTKLSNHRIYVQSQYLGQEKQVICRTLLS